MKHPTRLLALLLLSMPLYSFAANIGNVVKEGDIVATRGSGGHLDLGLELGLVSGSIYGYPENNTDSDFHGAGFIEISVNGRYQWRNGLFVEAYSGSIVGGGLGYNFYEGEKWAFDILMTEMHGYLGEDTSDEWEDLEERDSDLGLGIRASYFSEEFVVQMHALTDISGAHDGALGSIYLGKNWQVRNWNFHALAGIGYHSSKAVDYYLGVSEEEANEQFEEFEGEAGFEFSTDIGVTYPLSEKWVFSASYQLDRLSDQLNQSPLVTSRYLHRLGASINYVF